MADSIETILGELRSHTAGARRRTDDVDRHFSLLEALIERYASHIPSCELVAVAEERGEDLGIVVDGCTCGLTGSYLRAYGLR